MMRRTFDMALKDTCKELRSLLEHVQNDMDKAEAGNKAAAQRVRTNSIRLEKVAKLFRKESIKAEKSGAMKKTKEAARKKTEKQAAPKKKAAPPKKQAATAKKPVAKRKAVVSKKASATRTSSARRKPTAKLPKRGRKR